MSGALTIREIDQARASTASPLASASVEVTVQSGRTREIRFAAERRRPADLEAAAAADLAATAARLPAGLRPRLVVEVGRVSARLCRDSGEQLLFTRAYRIASCRGVVLGVREAATAAGDFDSPWTGTLAKDRLELSLPVVLAPSAVLALVSYALEVTGDQVTAEEEMPGLTVLDTAASPYPPQHHPFAEDGAASADRPLVEEGRWRRRRERAGGEVDPSFFLLTRPDRALRPLAAATRFNRRNLAVRCRRTVPVPAPALVVDSWRVRMGPRRGVVPFHAELSRLGASGERLALDTVAAVHCDPWQVLAHVLGAGGPGAPAVDEDPIEGDSYGCAPTLVTGLTFADLAGLSAEAFRREA